MSISTYTRKAKYIDLKDYCPFSEKNDFVELTEWHNGEGFDVTTTTNFSTTGTVYINSTYTGATGTRTFVTGFTEAQAAGYDVKTSGSTGIVIGASSDIVTFTGNFNNFDLTGFTGTLSNKLEGDFLVYKQIYFYPLIFFSNKEVLRNELGELIIIFVLDKIVKSIKESITLSLVLSTLSHQEEFLFTFST